ncbi:MAG: mycofactocin-coupled SDR family oxidoreductase [Nocardioides sp.]|uniref:mycofactocin-coupled SDR family oxidoreductase n=1 Tax=Nocardioides sp. TaxID=35761 RepID=UPI0039E38D93
MSKRMQGKVVFVTGTARGQGRAIAVRMAKEGADVIGVDLAGPLPGVPYDSPTPEDLAATISQIEAVGGRHLIEQGDVRDLAGLRDLVDRGVEMFGRLDGIAGNAAICIPSTWAETTPEQFRDTMDINVTGVWNTVMAGAPHLIEAGAGSIVLTSSYAGVKVQPFMIPYTTSKHAVTGMTRAFAVELGKYNIRVNSIHPGAVETPMGSGDMQSRIAETNATNPPMGEMATAFLPDRRIDVEDIADLVLFLLGDDSKKITSDHVTIDAGAHHY